MELTNDIKLETLIKAKKRLSDNPIYDGLCSNIYFSLFEITKEYLPDCVIHNEFDLLKYKPKDSDEIGYWFELDMDGFLKRIQILDELIQHFTNLQTQQDNEK